MLRHRVSGEMKRVSIGWDREDGMWELVRAGGRDGLADYESSESPVMPPNDSSLSSNRLANVTLSQ